MQILPYNGRVTLPWLAGELHDRASSHHPQWDQHVTYTSPAAAIAHTAAAMPWRCLDCYEMFAPGLAAASIPCEHMVRL